jgi:hypothetical protein
VGCVETVVGWVWGGAVVVDGSVSRLGSLDARQPDSMLASKITDNNKEIKYFMFLLLSQIAGFSRTPDIHVPLCRILQQSY